MPSYSRIFLLLQFLPFQPFLFSLLLLFLLAVSVKGWSIHVVAGDAKSSTKTVILLLVGCSQSVSLCHPERKQTSQLCINDTVQYEPMSTGYFIGMLQSWVFQCRGISCVLYRYTNLYPEQFVVMTSTCQLARRNQKEVDESSASHCRVTPK